jgi:putative FmdB family regulatory protein
MPLYEYQCPDCDARFDRLIRSSDSAPKIICPTCGSERPERLLSMFATSGPRSSSSSSSSAAAPACGPVG